MEVFLKSMGYKEYDSNYWVHTFCFIHILFFAWYAMLFLGKRINSPFGGRVGDGGFKKSEWKWAWERKISLEFYHHSHSVSRSKQNFASLSWLRHFFKSLKIIFCNAYKCCILVFGLGVPAMFFSFAKCSFVKKRIKAGLSVFK